MKIRLISKLVGNRSQIWRNNYQSWNNLIYSFNIFKGFFFFSHLNPLCNSSECSSRNFLLIYRKYNLSVITKIIGRQVFILMCATGIAKTSSGIFCCWKNTALNPHLSVFWSLKKALNFLEELFNISLNTSKKVELLVSLKKDFLKFLSNS